MSELQFGALLLFLVPGLLSYCALYGLFQPRPLVAQAPPPANSIESLTIILCASLITQAITAILVVVNHTLVAFDVVLLEHEWARYLDLYVLFWRMTTNSASDAADGGPIEIFILATLVQGAMAYAAVWGLLILRTKDDRLPFWLYGWAAELANNLDSDDAVWIATVLTTSEAQGRCVIYAGSIVDLHVLRDGCVQRITLREAERYVVDLNQPRTEMVPLSRYPLMTIDSANIRNIAFERLPLKTFPSPFTLSSEELKRLLRIALDSEANRIQDILDTSD